MPPANDEKNYSSSFRKRRGELSLDDDDNQGNKRRRLNMSGSTSQEQQPSLQLARSSTTEKLPPPSQKKSGSCNFLDKGRKFCNRACCKPLEIPGLTKLLKNEDLPISQRRTSFPAKEQSPPIIIEPGTASTSTIFVFENLNLVDHYQKERERRREGKVNNPWKEGSVDTRETDKYSFRFGGGGSVPHYYYSGVRGRTPFRQYVMTCDTCSYGYSSYGFDPDVVDRELLLLPQYEFQVSSKLTYMPFQRKRQQMISNIYDWKEELRDLAAFKNKNRFSLGENDPKAKMKKLNKQCQQQTKKVYDLLKFYLVQEKEAKNSLTLVSLSVYKCHLQQQVAIGQKKKFGKESLDEFLKRQWKV